MENKRFIELVREYSGLPSDDETVRITRATLVTLGERAPRTDRAHLAAQLPPELKEFLLERKKTERFTLEEFYNRVSARSGFARTHVLVLARAVIRVLREAAAEGELEDILIQLPADYRELFGKEPGTSASPTSLTAKEVKHLEKSGPSHEKRAQ